MSNDQTKHFPQRPKTYRRHRWGRRRRRYTIYFQRIQMLVNCGMNQANFPNVWLCMRMCVNNGCDSSVYWESIKCILYWKLTVFLIDYRQRMAFNQINWWHCKYAMHQTTGNEFNFFSFFYFVTFFLKSKIRIENKLSFIYTLCQSIAAGENTFRKWHRQSARENHHK